MTNKFLIVCGGSGVGLLGQRRVLGIDGELHIDVSSEINSQLAVIDERSLSLMLDRVQDAGTAALLLNYTEKQAEKLPDELQKKHTRYLAKHYPASHSLRDGLARSPALAGLVIRHEQNISELDSQLETMISRWAGGVGPTNPLTFWIISSTAGGTGEGTHRFVGERIVKILSTNQAARVRLNFIRIGSGTYRAVDHERTTLNSFLGIAADTAFNFRIPREYQNMNVASYWFYLEVPPSGVGDAAKPIRARVIEMACKAIMLDELQEAFNTIVVNDGIGLVRVGYWGKDFDEKAKYLETLNQLVAKLQDLIEPDGFAKYVHGKREPDFEGGEGLRRIRDLLSSADFIYQQMNNRGWEFPKYTAPRLPETPNEIWKLVQQWKNAIDQLATPIGIDDIKPGFVTAQKMKRENSGETEDRRVPLSVPGVHAVEPYSLPWFERIEITQQVKAWTDALLGTGLGNDGLLIRLHKLARDCSDAQHPGFPQSLTTNAQQKADNIRKHLLDFIEPLVKVIELWELRRAAENMLEDTLRNTRKVLSTAREQQIIAKGAIRGVEESPVIAAELYDPLHDITKETWLQMLDNAVRRQDSNLFRKQVLAGAVGLTYTGLLSVLGLRYNAHAEEIKAELRMRAGQMYDQDGLVYDAQWWNHEMPPGIRHKFIYRILPKLEPAVRNELGMEDREIKYLYTGLGLVGLNVIAFEGITIAERNGLVTTPAYLLRGFVPLVKEYLADERWVDVPIGRPSAKLSLVSAGVRDEPLFRPALVEAGLTEKEIERIGEFYQLYDPFKREQETEAVQTEPIEPEVNVDELESRMRNLVKEQSYQEARSLLTTIDQLEPPQLPLLKDEFRFLFNLDNPAEKDLEQIKREPQRVQWRRQMWQILSQRNDFPLKVADHTTLQEIVASVDTSQQLQSVRGNETVSGTFVAAKTSAQEKGEKLELATVRLFQSFFTMGKDSQQVILNALRRQSTGTQYGHDISFEFEDTVQNNPSVKCHVECKNYSKEITLKDVADKLLSERAQSTGIHHWILISPHANPSNELNQLLALWKENADFPFEIQIWCPDTNVQEFFGLDPKVFARFYRSKKQSISPRTWTEAQHQEIYKRWQNKLNPPLRLPAGWSAYLRNPEYLLLSNETHKAYDHLYANYVPLRCKDADGNLIGEPLEEHVMNWLNDNSKPAVFLLGDFGDGKTAFTYIFTRKLAEQFVKNPPQGWIPVRFALREYKAGNSQEFLKQRLERFGADLKGWTNLKTRLRVLVILDGFDEMTIKLDAPSITRNIKSLEECCEEFDGMKILITSRTHFFKNLRDVERLRERIHNPEMVYLAPISRYSVMRHLGDRATSEEQKETLRAICKLHDPIGLASKPLFLQMVEETIYGTLDRRTLPSDLNELILYESYVNQTLHRKMQFLEDDSANVLPSEIIQSLHKLLEEIAYGVHISEGKYVLLSEFQDAYGPLAEKLWKISETAEENVPTPENVATGEQDVTARVEIRSLLTRVKTDQADDKWPVDFCHRSLREYFVARRICRYLEEDLEKAKSVLANTQFGHEIIDFAAEFMRANQDENWEERLMALVRSTKAENQGSYLGANSVTLLFRLKGQLPDNDWSGLTLDQVDLAGADLSGKNFSNTSLQNANLDNANFENSDFRNSDLTGVRFEETARVQALAVHPSRNSLIVAYEDGSIREWSLTHPRKSESRLIFNETSANLQWIGFSPMEDLWSLTDDNVVFYDRMGMNALSARARFLIKPECRVVIPKEQILLVMSETGNLRSQTRLVDLGRLEIVYSIDHADTSLCDHADHNVFVLAQQSGLRLEQFGVTTISKSIEIPTNELSSICLQDISPDKQFLLACGYKTGLVRVWKLNANSSDWKYEEIASCSAHEGTVTSIAFLDENRVVSGGIDRKIRIINFGDGQGSPQGIIERTLQLSIRCRGMMIDGIRGTQAKKKLTELIAQAQKPDN